jgi:hypothetical protein
MQTNTNMSIQIFVYNTNIKFNYPIITFNSDQELIEFVESLHVSKMGKFHGEKPFFVINNSHLLPNDVKIIHDARGIYYLIEKNLDLVKSKIPSMTNRAEEFIGLIENFV